MTVTAGEPQAAAPPEVGVGAAPRVWWWPYALVLGLSVAARVGLELAGNPFDLQQLHPSVMHLVEPDVLASNPLAALWDVHTNPPLFNTGVGVLLRWSPLSDPATFRVVFTLGALVAAVGLCEVLRSLGCRWWIAAVVAALAFTDPAVVAFEFYVAQESFVLPLLYGTLWAIARYGRAPSTGRLAVVLALATLLVLTRALFNPLWLLGLVAVVLVVRPPPVSARRLALVAALPFLLVGAVMVKNQVRFGAPSLSSWMGMNLSRVAVMPLGPDRIEEMIEDGVLSETAREERFGAYADFEPAMGPCDTDFGTQVLDDPAKHEGFGPRHANFNAACFVPVYDRAMSDSIAAIREEPGIYARAVQANLIVYLSDGEDGAARIGGVEGGLADTLSDVHGVVGLEVTRVATYPNLWGGEHDVRMTFVIGLVVVSVAGVRAARRRFSGTATGRDALVLAITWTVLSVSVVGVVADAFENARFRAPLDPLVIGIVVAGAAEAAARVVGARRSAADEPGEPIG